MNVIPEFPNALPTEVPDQVAAPAPVISWKSVFVRETVAAVIVLVVPRVLLLTRSLFVALFPVKVKVPVIIRLPLKTLLALWDAPPVLVRFVKVIDPVIA